MDKSNLLIDFNSPAQKKDLKPLIPVPPQTSALVPKEIDEPSVDPFEVQDMEASDPFDGVLQRALHTGSSDTGGEPTAGADAQISDGKSQIHIKSEAQDSTKALCVENIEKSIETVSSSSHDNVSNKKPLETDQVSSRNEIPEDCKLDLKNSQNITVVKINAQDSLINSPKVLVAIESGNQSQLSADMSTEEGLKAVIAKRVNRCIQEALNGSLNQNKNRSNSVFKKPQNKRSLSFIGLSTVLDGKKCDILNKSCTVVNDTFNCETQKHDASSDSSGFGLLTPSSTDVSIEGDIEDQVFKEARKLSRTFIKLAESFRQDSDSDDDDLMSCKPRWMYTDSSEDEEQKLLKDPALNIRRRGDSSTPSSPALQPPKLNDSPALLAYKSRRSTSHLQAHNNEQFQTPEVVSMIPGFLLDIEGTLLTLRQSWSTAWMKPLLLFEQQNPQWEQMYRHYLEMESLKVAVQVAVRVRPLVQHELASGCSSDVEVLPEGQQIVTKKRKDKFIFNYVFDSSTPQIDVYETAVQSLVQQLFKGYNVTVLAYGQTGSGKTYSMGTCPSSHRADEGIIQRAVNDMFSKIESDEEWIFNVSVSFLELYNEQLIDLLSENRKNNTVNLRESNGGIVIPGLTQTQAHTAREVLTCLQKGSENRTTGATAMNAQSSRSHAIFTIYIHQTKQADEHKVLSAKFQLVDLAGSRRSKKTKSEGERFKEDVQINMALFSLGNVISSLCDNASFVNYRVSQLTRLLQDSLGGNALTLMLACVSPVDTYNRETLNTLRYADKTQKIKNTPVINEESQKQEINGLKQTALQELRDGYEPPQAQLAEKETMLKEEIEKHENTENTESNPNEKALQELRDGYEPPQAQLAEKETMLEEIEKHENTELGLPNEKKEKTAVKRSVDGQPCCNCMPTFKLCSLLCGWKKNRSYRSGGCNCDDAEQYPNLSTSNPKDDSTSDDSDISFKKPRLI